MNNKGFSLVEILTVIVIMVLLSGISYVIYNNVSMESKEKLNRNVEKQIIDAASAFCSNPNYIDNITKCGSYTEQVSPTPPTIINGTITIADLVSEKLLEGELIDYVNEAKLCNTATISIEPKSKYDLNIIFDIDDPSNYACT